MHNMCGLSHTQLVYTMSSVTVQYNKSLRAYKTCLGHTMHSMMSYKSHMVLMQVCTYVCMPRDVHTDILPTGNAHLHFCGGVTVRPVRMVENGNTHSAHSQHTNICIQQQIHYSIPQQLHLNTLRSSQAQ